jgi:hypothetical protein
MSRPERQRGHLPQDFGGCVSLFVWFFFFLVGGLKDGTGRAWWVEGWRVLVMGMGIGMGLGRWKRGLERGRDWIRVRFDDSLRQLGLRPSTQ